MTSLVDSVYMFCYYILFIYFMHVFSLLIILFVFKFFTLIVLFIIFSSFIVEYNKSANPNPQNEPSFGLPYHTMPRSDLQFCFANLSSFKDFIFTLDSPLFELQT